MMMQPVPVNVAPEPGVIVDKLEGHPVHVSDSGTIDEKKESPAEEEHAEYNMSMQQEQRLIQQHYIHNPYAQHQHQYPPHMMAGMVPPQQVYIQQHQQQHHQLPLESQFQSMGLGDTNGGGAGQGGNDSSNNNNSSEDANNGDSRNNVNDGSNDRNDESNDGNGDRIANEDGGDRNGNEDEPIKLFVGQVPKTMNEEDIFPTFNDFGPLKDVSIIRDKHTQLHRGCAFVTYLSASDAEQAQEALHGRHFFPGARRPAQVKPAEPSVQENKLFIGMLSRRAGEDEVRELFAPFGEIREIYMIRNGDGTSKCAAFLRYVGRDAAVNAIEALHNNLVMEGAARPLIVKFADTKHQRHVRQMRSVRRHEMFIGGPAGGYPGPYPGHHMPMGPPPVGGPPHQYAAHMGAPPHQMQHYGGPYPGPGAGGQMYNPMGYPPAPHYPSPHPYGGFSERQGQGPDGGHQHQSTHPQRMKDGIRGNPRHHNQSTNPRPREGPAGANLFVYHLPHDLTDADLATAFNPFGNVISAKVYVDRYTGDSKGFGFVSYDSVISAESAIEQMNGFQIGNKRLKVQHKRVHNNGGGNRGGGQHGAGIGHHEQQQPKPQQQQQQPPPQGIPLDTAPSNAALDSGKPVPDPAEGSAAPSSGGETSGILP